MLNYLHSLYRLVYLLINLALLCLLTTPALTLSAGSATAQAAPAPTSPLLQFTAAGHLLAFRPTQMVLANPQYALQVDFVGANPITPQKDEQVTQGENLSFFSPSPKSGVESPRGEIQHLKSVVYPNLWPGVTLLYEGTSTAIAKSTYIIAPETPASLLPDLTSKINQIRLQYNVPVHLDAAGNLILEFETGHLQESAPIAWQEINGHRIPVEVHFILLDSPSHLSIQNPVVGFAAGPHHPAYPLIIDPSLTWNTFLGSGGGDYGAAIAVDEAGNVYIAGSSNTAWGTPINPYTSGSDAFVAKFNNNGVRQWHTFLGSGNNEEGFAIDLDTAGNIYIAGWGDGAWSTPVNPHTAGYDAFVAKLNNNGIHQWHTFLGSGNTDFGYDITVDQVGNIFVVGESAATWGVPVNPYTAFGDAFVAKLNNNGARQWHTFLGSANSDHGRAIAVDATGNIFVTGWSRATWGTPVNPYVANDDAFVTKLDSNGIYQWHTFLGSGSDDHSRAIAVDAAGNIFVAGGSGATWGTPVNPYTALGDAFAAKLNNNGTQQWNTFLGSGGGDFAEAIALDEAGNVYIAGSSNTAWGTPVNPYTALGDAFAAKLNSNGIRQWHTFLGSGNFDQGFAITVDEASNVYVAGWAEDTWGLPVNSYTGSVDAFAAKISPPYLASTTPSPNSQSASLTSTLTLTYSLPLSSPTVSTSTLIVHGIQTGRITPTYIASGSLIKIAPTLPFKPGELIQITSSRNLLGADYDENAVPRVWQFRARVKTGTGNFINSDQSLGPGDASKIALGDLDGDSDLDAFMASAGTLTPPGPPNKVWFNNGQARFSNSSQSLGSKVSTAVALGDLDNDGDLDAFVGHGSGQSDEIWLNNGLGQFSLHASLGDTDWASDLALGDLDKDGDLDALIANGKTQPDRVWLNSGQANFTHSNETGYNLGLTSSLSVALGDLDSDGDLDAFVGNEAHPNEVWQNDGSGHFSLIQSLNNPYNSRDVTLSDLNGDNKLDAFIVNGSNLGQPDQVWFNNGQGQFTNSGQSLGNDNSHGLSLGDVDADGDLDALVADFDGSRVWYNSGQGLFTGGAKLTEADSWSVDLGDLDGDGDLDAFFGNSSNQFNELWLNQLAIPPHKLYLPLLLKPKPN